MSSLKPSFLESLQFSDHELSVLRALGQYCGRQRVYEATRPKVLDDFKFAAEMPWGGS